MPSGRLSVRLDKSFNFISVSSCLMVTCREAGLVDCRVPDLVILTEGIEDFVLVLVLT